MASKSQEKGCGLPPLVSIIIPVKPGGHVKALEAVRQLDWPAERLEVFVAEGRQPSRQRNEAARMAAGGILYFLDDDSSPDPSNLRRIVSHFADREVAVAGGPSLTPADDSFIQRCFASLFTSPFGGAGIRNRYRSAGEARASSEKELILCNLAFRKEVFERFGGLNERLYPNEENDLMVRIKEAGLKLIHDPGLLVERSQRRNLRLFIRQIMNYGRGRMEQTLLYPASFGPAHFVPLFFLLYILSLPFARGEIYLLPLILYLLLDMVFSALAAREDGAAVYMKTGKFLVMTALFPLMHLSYGAGMLWGGMSPFRKERGRGEVRVSRISAEWSAAG